MIPLGQPKFQGTVYYRYENRDQRTDISSLMRDKICWHPDTTSVTIFSNPSQGIAKIEVSESLSEGLDLVPDPNTPKIQKALAWLETHLTAMGIHKVNPEDVPPESKSKDEFQSGHRRREF